MRDRAEVLEAGILFLEGITYRIAFSVEFYIRRLDFDCLAAAYGFDELAAYGYAGAGAYLGKQLRVSGGLVHHYLYVVDGGTVVKRDERYFLVTSLRAHPTFGEDVLAGCLLQKIFDLCSEYFF